jgi:hypothetical protein
VIAVQLAQRPLVLQTLRAQPSDPLPPGPLREATAVVSDDFIGPTFRHQRQPAPKPPLVVYRTSVDEKLDRMLGASPLALPAGVATVRFDDGGRVHVSLDPSAVGRIWLALDHVNGPSRYFVSHPVRRADVTLPLSRSIRRVVLFEPGYGAAWPAQAWNAPAFLDPWPSDTRD